MTERRRGRAKIVRLADYKRITLTAEHRKQCRECGAVAKIMDEIDHAPACSGSPNICEVLPPDGSGAP